MKYIFKVVSILTVLVLLFSLTSCSFRFSSFDNLLRPPKLIGKYQGLQDSFESSIKDSFQLLIPENGGFQSTKKRLFFILLKIRLILQSFHSLNIKMKTGCMFLLLMA